MTTTNQETTSPTSLPPAGQNVFTACKKCGEERYHKILAHKTATSAQVQCEVCKAKKTYKLPAPPKAKKATKKKTKAAAQPKGPTWEALKEEIGTNNVQSYKMSANFEMKTAISHPKWGVGFITYASPVKIDVLFETGPISLVHNRST